MSVVAKILIVLNLLLAVVFLGSSATYLGAKETWKKKHGVLKVQTDAEISELKQQRDTLDGKFRAQGVETATVQNDLTEVLSKYSTKEDQYKDIVQKYATLEKELQGLTQIKDNIVKQNQDLTDQKNAALAEKETALSEKRQAIQAENSAVTEQRRLQDQVNDGEDMIAELEKRSVVLSDTIEGLQMQLRVYVKKFGTVAEIATAPALAAKVSAVNNDLNIIVLSIGRDDMVKPGYEFTIYRGQEFVAKVVIDKVDKDFCSGYSRKELEQTDIEVGDEATTRF